MRNDKEIYLEKEKTRSGIAAIPGGRVHTALCTAKRSLYKSNYT